MTKITSARDAFNTKIDHELDQLIQVINNEIIKSNSNISITTKKYSPYKIASVLTDKLKDLLINEGYSNIDIEINYDYSLSIYFENPYT